MDEVNKNMRYADMQDADMRNANMRGANMRDAVMRNANMRGANMRNADMRDADMQYANMRDANMRYTNMRCADMRGADMTNANCQLILRDDGRGYGVHVDWMEDGRHLYRAGCRCNFTFEDAVTHWTNPYHESPECAARILAAIRRFEESVQAGEQSIKQ